MLMRLSIVILAVAFATVYNGRQRTAMANGYLISKWKTCFKIMDVNHDGIISLADIEKTSGTFSKLHHFDADKRKKVDAKFVKWWKNYIFEGHTDQITESQFVDVLNAEFSTNKHKFNKRMARYIDTLYKDFLDTNKDGFISEEEFISAYQVYGQEHVALVKHFFESYKQDPITLSTAIKSWVSFTTEEDESKESLKNMKTGIENIMIETPVMFNFKQLHFADMCSDKTHLHNTQSYLHHLGHN